ncbi:MFS transporter [Sphingomonas sp. BK069]|uniref:MFS transporter n=1 Tax=Sphingomonas sp. BK069 TaxID=2586979 RepID=UPI00160BD37B|nr:MFS transporter [Sphingomonas sp. BK069]MBB3348338.1 hypothetical protein [Sphingomonas sp. BK069]
MVASTRAADTGPEYVFADDERPTTLGSPYLPRHTFPHRICYLIIGLFCGVTSNLTNSLVTVNLGSLGGGLGVYAAEAAWLPAVFVAFNATANLTLIKARAQFGIAPISNLLLSAYALALVAELLWPGFALTLAVRALAGLAMAGLVTLGIYNIIQAFPAATRPIGVLIGISVPQLGPPIARLFPVEALALYGWSGLHLVELALVLTALAATRALPVPHGDRVRTFEPLDAVTICLVVPGALLVCGVLSVGRYVWWTDASWIRSSILAAVPLLACAFAIEHVRTRPLVQTRWIGTAEMLGFAMVAVLVRLALAEQTYGSVGLLSLGGLINDQMHLLFVLVLGAMVAGIAVAAAITRPGRILKVVLAASLVIALGAWLDTKVGDLSRPRQLYASQMLIGFGTMLFMGPSLLLGFVRALHRGADHVITYIVLFSTTQNVGGLAGAALLGSLQVVSSRENVVGIGERLTTADPLVVDRIRSYSAAAAVQGGDAALAGQRGAAMLGQAVTGRANVLAFVDVFWFVTLLALATASLIVLISVVRGSEAPSGATP